MLNIQYIIIIFKYWRLWLICLINQVRIYGNCRHVRPALHLSSSAMQFDSNWAHLSYARCVDTCASQCGNIAMQQMKLTISESWKCRILLIRNMTGMMAIESCGSKTIEGGFHVDSICVQWKCVRKKLITHPSSSRHWA